MLEVFGTMDELQVLGERIREIRIKRGLSISGLADMAELNKSQIFRIENGLSDPHYSTLMKIARALEVNLSSFEVDHENLW